MRNVVNIKRMTGMVQNADFICPAGKSRYCIRVMALLLELADYFLRGLQNVPDEKACTSLTKAVGNT